MFRFVFSKSSYKSNRLNAILFRKFGCSPNLTLTKASRVTKLLPARSSTTCRSCNMSILGFRCLFISTYRSFSSKVSEDVMNVFDRSAKRKQRNRTALVDNYAVFDYIKDEVGWRMADRIGDVSRKFDVALDLGCGRGHIAKHILPDTVGFLCQCDMAELVLNQSVSSPEVETARLVADEEQIPFKSDCFDLVISSMSLHWVNDLPSTFRQIWRILRNDGCLMGAMFGGDTLHELRVSLQVAETEQQGGFSAHVSPFTSAQDLGGLLNRSGFTMLTIDVDEITVNYPSMHELMSDLRGMGENNCAWNRRSMIHRKTIAAAADKYKEMYGNKDGVPATYQILSFIGWKPDKSQAQPAKRGSGQFSMKDIDKLGAVEKKLKELNNDVKDDENIQTTIAQLQQAVDKARSFNTDEKNKTDKE